MPDHGTGRVHRFRDHVIAGVNWRPTRFVDEVPNSRVCGLCRMIPKRMVLLPCGHALCQSCHTSSLERSVGQCPLDQEPFEEAECFGYQFPTRKANTLKVHCWNEAHDCEYTGTMDRMLEHYEKECAFHTVECLRCGEAVRHSALPTHYVSGCIHDASIIEHPSLESTEVTLEDVSAALEDLKAMFGDPNHDPLDPVIQRQLNELTEHVRNQEGRFAVITRELQVCEQNLRGDMARIAATISSTVSHYLTSQQKLVEEASPSSSLPLRSEKQLIHRKLEHVADQSHDVPEHLQQTSTRLDSSRVIALCQPLNFVIRHLTSALSATRARINAIGRLRYVPTLENCQEIIHWNGVRRKFAGIMVWHMKDAYFKLAVLKERFRFVPCLTVLITFYGILLNSRCLPPVWPVEVLNTVEQNSFSLSSLHEPCSCWRDEDSLVHFQLGFRSNMFLLEAEGFLQGGKMKFRIELDDEEMNDGIAGVPNVGSH